MNLKKNVILFIVFFSGFLFHLKPALATIGESCCRAGGGNIGNVWTYNKEDNLCEKIWGGVRVNTEPISCTPVTEKCQEGPPDNRGTCISSDPTFTPIPTPTTAFTEGLCNLNPSNLGSDFIGTVFLTYPTIETGRNYLIIFPNGNPLDQKATTDGQLQFIVYMNTQPMKSGRIEVRRLTGGRDLVCSAIIITSAGGYIEPPPVDYTCTTSKEEAGVKTAIGCIATDYPSNFAGSILGKLIFVASGIAFLLMAFGAIQIITSAGNPDKMKAGSQLITSALSGLIFIILSVFLLKLIGVDILRIPGFGS